MDLRFWRRRDVETKAQSPLSPRLQSLLEQGPLSVEGSLSFFETFGTSYGKLYRSQSAFRSVVDFLSRNLAQCRIRLLHEDGDGVRLPEPDHKVQRLLDHPAVGVPRARFMRQLAADKAIYDVCATWKIRENFDPTPNSTTRRARNSGEVVSLVRIPVPSITIWQGSVTAPLEFRIDAGADSVIVPSDDVIWMPGYSPTSNTLGVAPTETLRQILAEEWAAGKDRENFWKRGVALNVVFTQAAEAEGLNAEQMENFKLQWQNRYGGVNASNRGEVPFLPPGVIPKELSVSSGEMEYLATRNLAREECCRAFGIQPQLLGITPANFASMDMFHQMLYQDTLTPWMVPIQEELEEQLLREFEDVDAGYYLEYNILAKLAGSFLDQAKIGQQAVGGPWMTRNEFREKFQGLPPIEGGDEIVIPSNVVIGGGSQANPQDAENQFGAKSRHDELAARRLRMKAPTDQPMQLTINVEPAQIDARPEIKVEVPPAQIAVPNVNVAAPQITVEAATPSVNVSVPELAPVFDVKVPEVTVNVPETSIDVHMPEQPSPVVNVEAPNVSVAPAAVSVNTPEITVNVPETQVEVKMPALEAPQIEVNVPEPHVEVHVPSSEVTVNVPEPRAKNRRVVRDDQGRVVGVDEEGALRRIVRDEDDRIVGIEEA